MLHIVKGLGGKGITITGVLDDYKQYHDDAQNLVHAASITVIGYAGGEYLQDVLLKILWLAHIL